jgi:hypothetical protein
MKAPSEEQLVAERSSLFEESKPDADASDSYLQDSVATDEEEECTGWFTGIGADFRTLAVSIKETAGGVVGFVQRSALSMAAEIAEMELREGQPRTSEENEPLRLPWEVRDCGEYHQDTILKENILHISLDEHNFLSPFTHENGEEGQPGERPFVLDEQRIDLIRRLLEIDANLSSMHARLAGRSNIRESIFWKNYFHRCELIRNGHLEAYDLDDVISQASSQNSLAPTDGKSIGGDSASSYVQVDSATMSAPSSLNSFLMVEKEVTSSALRSE